MPNNPPTQNQNPSPTPPPAVKTFGTDPMYYIQAGTLYLTTGLVWSNTLTRACLFSTWPAVKDALRAVGRGELVKEL